MVTSTCGCKEYFEDERSDTESLKPSKPPKKNTLAFPPIMVPPMAVHDMHLPPPPPVAALPNPEPAIGYPMPVFQQPMQIQMPQPAFLTGPMGAAPQIPAAMPGVLYPPQPQMGMGVPVVQFPQPAYPGAGGGMMPAQMPAMQGMAAGRPGLPVFGTPNGQPNPIGPPGGGVPGQPQFVMPPMAAQNQPF